MSKAHTSRDALQAIQDAFTGIKDLSLSPGVFWPDDPDTIVHQAFKVIPSTVNTSVTARCTTYRRTVQVQVSYKNRFGPDGQAFTALDLADLEDEMSDALLALEAVDVSGLTWNYQGRADGLVILAIASFTVEYTRPR